MIDEQCWQIIQGFGLEWVYMGNDALVYHHGTRNVHLLTLQAAQAMRSFELQPMTLRALREELSRKNSVAEKLSEKQLVALIKELLRLCLIEPYLS